MAATVGVISDTHGLLRPEALQKLASVSLIIHAGDIGSPEILAALEGIAPVAAIRGNIDTAEWARTIPETRAVEIQNVRIFVLHDRKMLSVDPVKAGYSCIISGHSHRPSTEMKDGILYLNPGSAGRRRFRLPVTLARLEISDGQLRPEIIPLG